jgi:hypothetical protein
LKYHEFDDAFPVSEIQYGIFKAKDQPMFSIHLFDFFRPEKLQSSVHMFASPGGLAQDHAQVR